jgi:hypothetical protein
VTDEEAPQPPSWPPPSAEVATEAHSTVAPPPRPRKRWIVVLVAALVLTLGIAVAGTVLFATNTWPPLDTAFEFTDDLEDGDVNAASAQLCDGLQTPAGRDNFEEFADELLDGLLTLTVNPFGVDRNGDRASVDFTANYRGDRHADYELVLVRERGDWRVCNIRFN